MHPLITPQLGLFFWTLVIFLTLFFLLRAKAWGPILKALDDRNKGIEDSLKAAAEAESRMRDLTSKNEQLLQEARAEQDKILREANRLKTEIVDAAKAEANEQKEKIISAARAQIASEKNAAIAEIKTLAGNLALDMAEKVLRKQLDNKAEQEKFVSGLISDIKLN